MLYKQTYVSFCMKFSNIVYIVSLFLFLLILNYRIGDWCVQQSYHNNILHQQKQLDSIQKNFDQHKKTRILANQISSQIQSAPIPRKYFSSISYEDTFGADRSINATYNSNSKRIHEGCDLMYHNDKAGVVPVLSMTDGIVEQLGWLTLGGYRIGIRSESDFYYYYAHLDSYKNGLAIGDQVHAGDLIGFMGDTGYGVEGTKGKFPVHLHVGIYVNQSLVSDVVSKEQPKINGLYIINKPVDNYPQEIAINPYKYLKKWIP